MRVALSLAIVSTVVFLVTVGYIIAESVRVMQEAQRGLMLP